MLCIMVRSYSGLKVVAPYGNRCKHKKATRDENPVILENEITWLWIWFMNLIDSIELVKLNCRKVPIYDYGFSIMVEKALAAKNLLKLVLMLKLLIWELFSLWYRNDFGPVKKTNKLSMLKRGGLCGVAPEIDACNWNVLII